MTELLLILQVEVDMVKFNDAIIFVHLRKRNHFDGINYIVYNKFVNSIIKIINKNGINSTLES